MTGNRNCQLIGTARLGDGAHRTGCANLLRYRSIAGSDPRRNPAEGFPDAALEGGSAHIQRQVYSQSRRLYGANHFGNHRLESRIGTDQLQDYARRKGWSLDEARRWLAPILDEPESTLSPGRSTPAAAP